MTTIGLFGEFVKFSVRPLCRLLRIPNVSWCQFKLSWKTLLLTGSLASAYQVVAMGLIGVVVILAVVFAIGVGTAILLKSLSDTPPSDRFRDLNQGTLPGQGNIWQYYTNHGLPPSFYFVQGTELPCTIGDPHPIHNPNNTNEILDYFEFVIVEPPPVVDISVCVALGGPLTCIGTAGNSLTPNGFTNDLCQVSIVNGTWDLIPTPYAKSNYQCLFFTARKR